MGGCSGLEQDPLQCFGPVALPSSLGATEQGPGRRRSRTRAGGQAWRSARGRGRPSLPSPLPRGTTRHRHAAGSLCQPSPPGNVAAFSATPSGVPAAHGTLRRRGRGQWGRCPPERRWGHGSPPCPVDPRRQGQAVGVSGLLLLPLARPQCQPVPATLWPCRLSRPDSGQRTGLACLPARPSCLLL